MQGCQILRSQGPLTQSPISIKGLKGREGELFPGAAQAAPWALSTSYQASLHYSSYVQIFSFLYMLSGLLFWQTLSLSTWS